MQEIALHLLDIAQNAVAAGARRISACLETGADGRLLVLTVEDDGPGFTPEALKRAVEPYFRDKAAARDGEHFGLGLYICRTLTERHGGALTVENAPEGGGRVRAAFRVMEEAKT